jgi:hypothetical protein
MQPPRAPPDRRLWQPRGARRALGPLVDFAKQTVERGSGVGRNTFELGEHSAGTSIRIGQPPKRLASGFDQRCAALRIACRGRQSAPRDPSRRARPSAPIASDCCAADLGIRVGCGLEQAPHRLRETPRPANAWIASTLVRRLCLPTSLEPVADRSPYPATAAGCAARLPARDRPQPRPGSRPECSTGRLRCPTLPKQRLARSDLRSWSRRPPLRPLPSRRGLPARGASKPGFRPAAILGYRRTLSSLRHRWRVRSARSHTATNPGPPVRWPRPADARPERAEWRQDREVRRIATGAADSVGRTIRK